MESKQTKKEDVSAETSAADQPVNQSTAKVEVEKVAETSPTNRWRFTGGYARGRLYTGTAKWSPIMDAYGSTWGLGYRFSERFVLSLNADFYQIKLPIYGGEAKSIAAIGPEFEFTPIRIGRVGETSIVKLGALLGAKSFNRYDHDRSNVPHGWIDSIGSLMSVYYGAKLEINFKSNAGFFVAADRTFDYLRTNETMRGGLTLRL